MSIDTKLTYENLIVERQGAVDWVSLNRPDKMNALSPDLVADLVDYLTSLRRNYDTRIVVLTGAGGGFCAGLDLEAYFIEDATVQLGYHLQLEMNEIMKLMRRIPQPIIALINGPACGAGFAIAMSADIRIAAKDAKMNAAFIRIGMSGCDMGSSYLLPRLVGSSIASELLLTGDFIHAERALAVNLVSAVVPKAELKDQAQKYVDSMLLTTPFGLRLTKDGLNFGIDATSLEAAMAIEDRQQTLTSQTEDTKEAWTAFLEKRKPNYKNR